MTTETQTVKNFIDGEFVEPVEGETESILNPASGEVIAHAPVSTAEGARAAEAGRRARGSLQDYTEIKHLMVALS